MAAQPGDPVRGRVSILAQHLCDVSFKLKLPGRVFVPPPKVLSQPGEFFPLVAAGFCYSDFLFSCFIFNYYGLQDILSIINKYPVNINLYDGKEHFSFNAL